MNHDYDECSIRHIHVLKSSYLP